MWGDVMGLDEQCCSGLHLDRRINHRKTWVGRDLNDAMSPCQGQCEHKL